MSDLRRSYADPMRLAARARSEDGRSFPGVAARRPRRAPGSDREPPARRGHPPVSAVARFRDRRRLGVDEPAGGAHGDRVARRPDIHVAGGCHPRRHPSGGDEARRRPGRRRSPAARTPPRRPSGRRHLVHAPRIGTRGRTHPASRGEDGAAVRRDAGGGAEEHARRSRAPRRDAAGGVAPRAAPGSPAVPAARTAAGATRGGGPRQRSRPS